MTDNEIKNSIKARTTTIRLRTWTLTLTIVVGLVLYFLVQVTTKNSISWVDFFLLVTLQILVYTLYFPDGELFGERNPNFVNNKEYYNGQAQKINEQRKIGRLREYCGFEFNDRKERYISKECGLIGITPKEFDVLSQKSEKEIKALEYLELTRVKDGTEIKRKLYLSKKKKKRLYNLIFNDLPVEYNQPETIMSATVNDGNKAIRDGSTRYKAGAYIRKFFQAVTFGLFFAYIGWTTRNGVGFAQIVSIFMYLATMFATAVTAFSSGETCSKVYKNRFYMELSIFIDCFWEWDAKTPKEEDEDVTALKVIHNEPAPLQLNAPTETTEAETPPETPPPQNAEEGTN